MKSRDAKTTTINKGTTLSWAALLVVFYIYFSIFASGSRALSSTVGDMLLVLADAALLSSFLILALRRTSYWAISVIMLTAYATILFILGSGSESYMALYLGIRKSIFLLIAVSIGISLRHSDLKVVLRAIYISLIIICLYGIKQSISMSSFDLALIGQQGSADYTNSIGGRLRAISFLSSGFHLGMAGCCLIAITISEKKFSLKGLLVVIIAFAAIDASATRTFMIIGTGLIVFRLVPFNLKSLTIGVVIASFATIVLSVMGYNVFEIITYTLLEDHRFASRGYSYISFEDYRTHNATLSWLGFGPGSAGSTMSNYFTDGYWIEPHSIYLKYIFEFGNILGLAIIASIIAIPLIGLMHFSLSEDYIKKMPIMLFLILAISGLTITSVEAAPISLYIGILLGGAIAPTNPT